MEPGATSGRLRLLAWPISLVTAFLPVEIIRQTALFEAGAILRLGGKCRGVALKARLAGVGCCLDGRYSVVDSRSVRHVAQGVLAHIGLFLRRQCISGKIGTIRSRKISKLINSESNSKFEIRK